MREEKEAEEINHWAIMGIIIILAVIIGSALLILGGNGPESAPVEKEINLTQKNETPGAEENDVDFEPPTEEEVSTYSLEYMSIREIADKWKIRADYYLYRFVDDYQLQGNYTVDSKLSELQAEGEFSTQRARDLATEIESIKQENEEWVWPELVQENEEI